MEKLQPLRAQTDALHDVELTPERVGDGGDILALGIFGQVENVTTIGLKAGW